MQHQQLLHRKKVLIVGMCVLLVLLSIHLLTREAPPQVSVTLPADRVKVSTTSIEISGTVTPPTSLLTVNGTVANLENRNWNAVIELSHGTNAVTVVAIHPENGKKAQGEFTVIREYTQAEREAKEQAEAEKRQRKVAEWQASPAGQICTSNPGWTRDECRALADGKIWIGMHYDMLVWRRGKPDHVNVSNYGYGNQYQYCWTYYTPSCFYDRDNDGLLDSYN